MDNDSSQNDFLSDQDPSFEESYDLISVPKEHLDIVFSQKSFIKHLDFSTLKEQADQGEAEAQFRVAECYRNGENIQRSYPSAILYYKLAADQGHRYAQYFLADLYDYGLGVKQDFVQALYYYKLAAEKNCPESLAKLGKFYYEGKGGVERSPEKAIDYYQTAEHLGSIAALDYLADAYEQGIGVEKSEERAWYYREKKFQCVKMQADEGDACAQALLGSYYQKGNGVEKSMESAVHYYQLSADQNYSKGLFKLGECYAEGRGVQRSSEKTIHYYSLAADQGYPLAQAMLAKYLLENKINEEQAVHYLKLIVQNRQCYFWLLASCEYNLAKCFEKGTGIRQSAKNALYYYTISAENGQKLAQKRLGDAYWKGELGLKKSPERAVEYYLLAGNQGCSCSLEIIGDCYALGKVVKQSYEKAFYYYKLAAEIDIKKGHGASIYVLARCFEYGVGTEKSLEKALQYYRFAGENGFSRGYYKLWRLYKEMGGEENARKAAAYFNLAVKGNDPYALYELQGGVCDLIDFII